MGYRNDRFAATGVLTASTTLRAGIIHPFDTSGGAISQSLPPATAFGPSNGFYILLETAGNSLTIAPAGADTINGIAQSITLSQAGDAVLFVRDRTAANWLILSTTLGGGVQSFLFQPGGPGVGPSIFADWTQLYNALNAVAGPRELYFDDQFESIAIPSGDWDMENVEWRTVGSGLNPRVQVSIAVNTTLPGLRRFRGALLVAYQGTGATAPVVLEDGACVSMYDGCSIITDNEGDQAFFSADGATVKFFMGGPRDVNLGNGTDSALELTNACAALFYLGVAAQLSAGCLADDGTCSATLTVQSTSATVGPQAGLTGTVQTTISASQRWNPTTDNVSPTFGELAQQATLPTLIALPEIVPGQLGWPVSVVNVTDGDDEIVVEPTAGQTIGGEISHTFSGPFAWRTYVPDETGTNWTVLGELSPPWTPVVPVGSPYNASLRELVLVPTQPWTVELPAISALNKGIPIRVKNNSDAFAAAITILPTGADTIDGQVSLIVAEARFVVELVSDGISNWVIC